MLIEFTVGNFKSFKGRQTFSMAAASLHSDPPKLDTTNITHVNKSLSLLKSAAIYGANASGKSNLGIALSRMKTFIFNSTMEIELQMDIDDLPFEPFLLSVDTEYEPCFFEIVFMAQERQYRYGFEIDSNDIENFRVVSEWLFHVPKTKESLLFKREKQAIEVGSDFEEGKQFERFEQIRPEALFLSIMRQFDGPVTKAITSWFRNFVVTIALNDNSFQRRTIDMLLSEEGQQRIQSLIDIFDTGIDGLKIEDTVELVPKLRRGGAIGRRRQEILANHSIYDSEGSPSGQTAFKLNKHESQGTRKLISMAGLILNILDNGRPWFVDELDARLHPLITRRLIELFHDPLTNPKGAQLIFTTHDTNLLDRTLLRRDQIWFTEKDTFGATHLYSLLEFHPRNDVSLEKNYLAGRYGAIPYLGDVTRMPQYEEEAIVA
jgi:AAA15 family ATPase/GTPase